MPKRPMKRRRNKQQEPGEPFPKEHMEVLGKTMAYTDEGTGPPIVFLHGGIGSSYLWRNVIPRLAPDARCIAVDLLGTGGSARLESSSGGETAVRAPRYEWDDHLKHLGAFFDAVSLGDDVTLVLHGWGGIVGLEWARVNEERVRGICHMEAITRPLAWHELPETMRTTVKRARGPDGRGYLMDSDEGFSDMLRVQVVNRLPSDVSDEYWRGFGESGDARRAMLSALNLIPVNAEPPESAALVKQTGTWFKQTGIPKLLVLGEPGYLVTGRTRELAERLPNQAVAKVPGAHLLPEESPDGVGLFISLWLQQLARSSDQGSGVRLVT